MLCGVGADAAGPRGRPDRVPRPGRPRLRPQLAGGQEGRESSPLSLFSRSPPSLLSPPVFRLPRKHEKSEKRLRRKTHSRRSVSHCSIAALPHGGIPREQRRCVTMRHCRCRSGRGPDRGSGRTSPRPGRAATLPLGTRGVGWGQQLGAGEPPPPPERFRRGGCLCGVYPGAGRPAQATSWLTTGQMDDHSDPVDLTTGQMDLTTGQTS